MNQRGARLHAFEDFERSILSVKSDLELLRKRRFDRLSEPDWKKLERVFKRIKVTKTQSKLVGISKTLAHLLPNLIPPVDNRYTLKFLRTTIPTDIDAQWRIMRQILKGFFYPVARNPKLQRMALRWLDNGSMYIWDTSLLKVVDNLVMGRMLDEPTR